jgi:23S rRNA pseudouridine955/2504/2580 synthase
LNGLRPKPEVRPASNPANGARLAAASTVIVDENHDGQRLDNFLLRICRGVPKSHVYRLIRSGQVRVNGGRADAERRLASGDRVRIPPLRTSSDAAPPDAEGAERGALRGVGQKVGQTGGQMPGRPAGHLGARAPQIPVVHDDDHLIVLNKPAGMAVHGGSGVSFGVIEAMRLQHPEARFLELAHRLDRETSGALLIARRRPALLSLQQQFRDRRTLKIYLAVVAGRWPRRTKVIRHSLRRLAAPDGDRRVVVDDDGRDAQTRVTGLAQFSLDGVGDFSLVMAQLDTGRTHQIRVHLAAEGMPIVGDDKYGDFALNRQMSRLGLRRMFLHAWRLEVDHPTGSGRLRLKVEPGPDFRAIGDAGLPAVAWATVLQPSPRGARTAMESTQ